jgi:hypothetical protein
MKNKIIKNDSWPKMQLNGMVLASQAQGLGSNLQYQKKKLE